MTKMTQEHVDAVAAFEGYADHFRGLIEHDGKGNTKHKERTIRRLREVREYLTSLVRSTKKTK